MRKLYRTPPISVFVIFQVYVCLSISAAAQSFNGNYGWPIITRKGDQLYEGKNVFRFLGLAAPNLQQNESQLKPDKSNRFPNDFEIRDILDGINREGGRVTRTFALSVYSSLDKNLPVYISGYRTYNEEAFRCLDRVIATCHEYDVRLIIPFLASQSFSGIRGVDEFAALSGKPLGSFWTDPQVKEDFKHLLNFILNRKNTVNGALYKNDPAILAWQLGNEFGNYIDDRKLGYDEWSPRIVAWSREMSAYIKSIDSNHLVMEAGGGEREVVMEDPNIDIMSDHLYEIWNANGGIFSDLGPIAAASRDVTKGKKALIIDEFGLGSTQNLVKLMQTIKNENISGGLLWSMRSHRRDGGWYYHNESGTKINSYHVPGFNSGYNYEETRLLDALRLEAYSIRGLPVPPVKKPYPPPVLMQREDGFTWRGSGGAIYYVLERAEKANGPFSVIATGLSDSVIGDAVDFEYTDRSSEPLVLYVDVFKKPGTTYYYRIKGVNQSGESDYSSILVVNP